MINLKMHLKVKLKYYIYSILVYLLLCIKNASPITHDHGKHCSHQHPKAHEVSINIT